MSIENRFNKYDRSDMLENVLALPDQMREVWNSSSDFILSRPSAGSTLVICGMGGSAIGAVLIRDLVNKNSDFSVHIERGYLLPAYASANSTVICVSYSGNTEEVLTLFDEAVQRGCEIGVITSGGELGRRAAEANASVMNIRGGLPPRAAIGLLFTSLLRLVVNWGIYRITDEEFTELLKKARFIIKEITPGYNSKDNLAFQLSKKLYKKIPLIYAGDGLLKGVSYRWKCQFNENGKIMAYSNIFPELGHNEIMGWECPDNIKKNLFLIFLIDRDDHPKVQKRMQVTYSMLEKLAGDSVVIDSSWYGNNSGGRLERLLSMLILGDMMSVYLAVGRGVDPTPIEKIETIKKLLKMGES